jgi:hypothetical protein
MAEHVPRAFLCYDHLDDQDRSVTAFRDALEWRSVESPQCGAAGPTSFTANIIDRHL